MRQWLVGLFVNEEYIELARVQFEERVQRREALNRELSGKDAQECMARVILRMRNGDKIWIPPMYNKAECLKDWLEKHSSLSNVTQMEGRR